MDKTKEKVEFKVKDLNLADWGRKEIKLAEHNAREALTYWSSDINAGWTQLGHSEMPLKVQQHKEYLDTGIDEKEEE